MLNTGNTCINLIRIFTLCTIDIIFYHIIAPTCNTIKTCQIIRSYSHNQNHKCIDEKLLSLKVYKLLKLQQYLRLVNAVAIHYLSKDDMYLRMHTILELLHNPIMESICQCNNIYFRKLYHKTFWIYIIN